MTTNILLIILIILVIISLIIILAIIYKYNSNIATYLKTYSFDPIHGIGGVINILNNIHNDIVCIKHNVENIHRLVQPKFEIKDIPNPIKSKYRYFKCIKLWEGCGNTKLNRIYKSTGYKYNVEDDALSGICLITSKRCKEHFIEVTKLEYDYQESSDAHFEDFMNKHIDRYKSKRNNYE